MSWSSDASAAGAPSLGGVLGAVVDGQTYKNLLYLVLAFPLGLLYWSILTFGFVFGLFLTIFAVGIAILVATVAAARVLAQFERWLANRLLTVDLEEPDDRPPSEGTWSSVRAILDAPSTWRGIGFLTLKLWVGIFGLVLLASLVNVLDLLTAPIRYPYSVEFGTVNEQPVVWSIDTLPEAVLAVPLAVVAGIIVLNVANGFAYAAERMAAALLDRREGPGESSVE